jgi:hypothetical protein
MRLMSQLGVRDGDQLIRLMVSVLCGYLAYYGFH